MIERQPKSLERRMTTTTVPRRALLAAIPLVAGSLAACAASSPTNANKKAGTFLLVHGAWHGSWCYQQVAQLLRDQGHRVFTVTLSGLAERSNLISPDINLSTHVQDVVNAVEWEELNDFVLVGHSYGGMVVTAAAEQIWRKVSAIVYLDAFIPESGQALAELNGDGARAALEQRAVATGGYLPPIPAKVFGIEERNQARVDAKCTKQPAKTFLERVPVASAYTRIPKKMYLRATRFKHPGFDRIAAKLQTNPAWAVQSWDVGHDMMVDVPEKTARYLMEAL
jgi:pimeloyl-ACP methyl ester carboxylesterase